MAMKIDFPGQFPGQVIPDASPTQGGLMTAQDKQNLNALVSAGGGPVVTNTKKSTPNSIATPILVVDLTKVPDETFGMIVFFSSEVDDGTDSQVLTGSVNANLALKIGLNATSQAQSSTSARTSGTFTAAFSWSFSGTTATLSITPNSSLITVIDLHTNFYVPFATHAAVSAAP
jgi:hypothetical protein